MGQETKLRNAAIRIHYSFTTAEHIINNLPFLKHYLQKLFSEILFYKFVISSYTIDSKLSLFFPSHIESFENPRHFMQQWLPTINESFLK